MPAAIEAIEALKERLGREKDLPVQSVRLTPVEAAELEKLERALGSMLPASYLQFIARHGLLSVTDWRGQERARMLSPSEVMEGHEYQKDFIEEDAFGDEEEDLEAARREAQVRKRLVPFQYISSRAVSDFYCFDTELRRDTGPLILQVFHDDFELAPWLLDASPDVSFCTFDFDEHLGWVLRECLEEGAWGRQEK
ncbi:SMI1/KNR4 family protein [Pyxidicoccus fallax]|uniref:SMI1/KNR4 family protein n=1 Tax=Pyxidicoccus fallax TaxID=394095 RepID=A0A848LJF9_9BACT|nr:SMI1/KNR4 family protein [Pyxidicoccus fallax]NPC81391.1 SMI1/KNR4 family protein [Pyxidicoccus fallax]